jgi:hypothetical protein
LRPNHVLHQNRNGIKTMSQPVAKKSIFWLRDMLRLRLDVCSCGRATVSGFILNDWLRPPTICEERIKHRAERDLPAAGSVERTDKEFTACPPSSTESCALFLTQHQP